MEHTSCVMNNEFESGNTFTTCCLRPGILDTSVTHIFNDIILLLSKKLIKTITIVNYLILNLGRLALYRALYNINYNILHIFIFGIG